MGAGRRTDQPKGLDPGDIFIEEDVMELELDDEPTMAWDDKAPSQEPSIEARRELARRLAEQARAQSGRKAVSEDDSPTQIRRRLSGLADRVSRPKSAQEALAEARRAEEARKARAQEDAEAARRAQEEARRQQEEARRQQEEARRRAAEQAEAQRRAQKERQEREAREAAELAAQERATFGPKTVARPRPKVTSTTITGPLDALLVEEKVTTLLENLESSLEVIDVYVDPPAAVVGPLWKAHGVRARHDGDLATTIAAESVYRALNTHPERVVAARVKFGAAEWAVWVDHETDQVLAALSPADLYLVGF